MAERLYTVKEVAEIFGVSERTIQNWVKWYGLQAFKVGKVMRFADADIQEFKKRHKTSTEEKSLLKPSKKKKKEKQEE